MFVILTIFLVMNYDTDDCCHRYYHYICKNVNGIYSFM